MTDKGLLTVPSSMTYTQVLVHDEIIVAVVSPKRVNKLSLSRLHGVTVLLYLIETTEDNEIISLVVECALTKAGKSPLVCNCINNAI